MQSNFWTIFSIILLTVSISTNVLRYPQVSGMLQPKLDSTQKIEPEINTNTKPEPANEPQTTIPQINPTTTNHPNTPKFNLNHEQKTTNETQTKENLPKEILHQERLPKEELKESLKEELPKGELIGESLPVGDLSSSRRLLPVVDGSVVVRESKPCYVVVVQGVPSAEAGFANPAFANEYVVSSTIHSDSHDLSLANLTTTNQLNNQQKSELPLPKNDKKQNLQDKEKPRTRLLNTIDSAIERPIVYD
jgi:hypothetical protein